MKTLMSFILIFLLPFTASADLSDEDFEAMLVATDHTVTLNQDMLVTLKNKANHPYWLEQIEAVEERTLKKGTEMKIVTIGCVGGKRSVQIVARLIEKILPTFYCSVGFEIEEGLFFNIHDSFARQNVKHFFIEHIEPIIEPIELVHQ